MIDLPDLQEQVKRAGGPSEPDLKGVLKRLEADLARLAPVSPEQSPQSRLPLADVYVYSPLEADRSSVVERVVFRERGFGVRRECQGCGKACTHCQGGVVKEPRGQGRDSLIASDLIELAREDVYDWAVVVSTDLLLIPVVRYVQSRGRKIIHGCFPPVAMDLTKECWASIDLRVF